MLENCREKVNNPQTHTKINTSFLMIINSLCSAVNKVTHFFWSPGITNFARFYRQENCYGGFLTIRADVICLAKCLSIEQKDTVYLI